MTAPILVAGEALIDLFPTEPGPLADAETLRRAAGGAPANVAVGLARLESPPLLWTRVGADPFGTHLEDVLTDEGIPPEFVVVDDTRKTAHTLVGEDEEGDQAFTFFKEGSATFAMDAGTVPDGRLDAVEWVHVGGVLLSEPQGREAMFDLLERAQAADCTVSFDPNTRLDLWPDRSTLESTVDRALGHADVVKTDREDLDFVAGEQSTDAFVEDLFSRGPHTVCLTRGGDGVYARSDERAPWGEAETEQASLDVDVVETTGAGDAFTAGLIHALQVDGESLPRAVRYANAVGALTTTGTGAMGPLPTPADVEALLEA